MNNDTFDVTFQLVFGRFRSWLFVRNKAGVVTQTGGMRVEP